MARTSQSLLDRLRAAPDSAAWGRFVDIYGPLIYRWLRQSGLQDHDACDVGQEVLIAVSREMPTFEYQPGKGSFRGWLRVIVIHRLRGFWRDRKAKPSNWAHGGLESKLAELADPNSQVTRCWDAEHDRHVLRRLLEMLQVEFEPTTWQAFWRVAIDGEKVVGAATSLGISVDSVYQAKSRVLRRLREESAGLLDEE